MVISFYGEGCFKISSGELNILTDPFNPSSGITPPRFKFDILLKTLASEEDISAPADKTADFQQIIGPGEYNIKDVDILGIGLEKESSKEFIKTIYLAEAEGIKLCFLGHLAEMPEPDVLSQLEEIDVLFIPAGGKPFIDQKSAVKLIKQINPKIAVPSFFKVSGLKRQAGDLKEFLSEANHQKSEPMEKISLKKKDLAEIKKTEIKVLKI